MHTRRLLCFLLGMWLATNIFIWIAASANSWMADTILASPDAPLAGIVKQSGYDTVRKVMMHEASEVTRFLFSGWGWIQLTLAIAVLGMLLSLKLGPVHLAAGALALLMTLAMHFLLTPQITGLGRVLDFIPANGMIAERSRLASLAGFYKFSQSLVMLVSAGLLVVFLRRTRSRRLSGVVLNQVNAVDNTNDAHVNR